MVVSTPSNGGIVNGGVSAPSGGVSALTNLCATNSDISAYGH